MGVIDHLFDNENIIVRMLRVTRKLEMGVAEINSIKRIKLKNVEIIKSFLFHLARGLRSGNTFKRGGRSQLRTLCVSDR